MPVVVPSMVAAANTAPTPTRRRLLEVEVEVEVEVRVTSDFMMISSGDSFAVV